MMRLTTLGGIGLTDAEDRPGPGEVMAQPKRLALLTYLTTAHPGSLVFRDTLLPLLWPEMDEARARRALRQTLYHLRSQLGDGVIVAGGRNNVGVDPDRLWCDAVAFERAVADDRLEQAVELYDGEFMAGFHPPTGAAYERWLDHVRDRLWRKAVAAASTLIDHAESEREVGRAIGHARWLVHLAPSDERAARTLIRLLAAAGDRAGAVAAYRAHARHLELALDLEPDPDTTALVEAIRDGALDTAEETPGHETVPAESRPPALPEEHALAVLPFCSLSGTASEVRLAEGLTEMLITELTRATDVPVISRTSVVGSHRDDETLVDLARRLGVDRVVEGTVQESGDRLRATVQLLASPPERHVWADSFERPLDTSFEAQAGLAGDIARAIARVLADAQTRSESISAEAQDAYFRGRCQFVRMTPAGFAEAARQFQDAIRSDPDFARAHAGLASAQAGLARSGRVPPAQGYAQAQRRARHALALEPHLPEAHLVLGTCATFLDWDWEHAERHLRRALRQSPDLPDIYWVYSNLLCITARPAEARRAARRARELDPVAPTVWLNEVLILVATGRLHEARTAAEGLSGFYRDSSAGAFALGLVREALGDHQEAAAHFARAVELGGGHHSTAAAAANLARSGRTDDARRILAELLDDRDRYVPPTGIARIHAALGEADNAFHWLDRAATERDDWLLYMDSWPRFPGMRQDPRFAALRRRIGLPEPSADEVVAP